MSLRIFKHLLPNARAWQLTVNKKLRDFFDGLSAGVVDESKDFIDSVFNDIDPKSTRQLSEWESQFALPQSLSDEQERRDRLDAAWKALGGQSPRYIENTLCAAGFDVYVHEWWVPGSEPVVGTLAAATARDPALYLTGGAEDKYLSADGAADMQDGDSLAADGTIDPAVTGTAWLSADGATDMQDGDAIAQDGATTAPTGYPLVNKLLTPTSEIISDGYAGMQDGDAVAQDGAIITVYNPKQYVLPVDGDTFPYFLYIGGQTFPDHATVKQSRRNEFEALCLKICPAQLWLGMLIDYS